MNRLIKLAFGISLFIATAVNSQGATIVNVFDTTAFGSSDPSGLTFLPDSSALLLSDSDVEETSFFVDGNIFQLSLSGTPLLTQSTLGFSNEPTGVAFNTATGTLFITDDDQKMVFEVDPLTLQVLSSFSTIDSGCTDPEGISFDPATGNLFIAGGVSRLICEVTPDGIFVSSFIVPDPIPDPEGIDFDIVSGNFFIVSGQDIFEVTTGGVLVRVIDILRPLGVRLKGITFAPSSDPAVDPSILNLFVADYGCDQVNDGRIFEISLLGGEQPPVVPGLVRPNCKALNIVINIATNSLKDGQLGIKYKATLKANGGMKPYTWHVLAGALPAGLTLNEATGKVGGIPLEVGSFDVTFGVTDSLGGTFEKTLTVTINASVPNIATNSLKDGQIGIKYKATLKANGGMKPYTWSVLPGTLPPGLTLNEATGKIKGTPTASGTFLLTFKVTDSFGGEASKILALTINP